LIVTKMSDSLADFFAKKDKKKSSRKGTEGRSSEVKSGKEKEKPIGAGLVRLLQTEDDGDWGEYEEQAEKDYSNLKIQNLTIK
jgi:hypothetical protein